MGAFLDVRYECADASSSDFQPTNGIDANEFVATCGVTGGGRLVLKLYGERCSFLEPCSATTE